MTSSGNTDAPIDVSVVIPAFNVADYVGDAIRSALAQTPPFRRIVVVDDGSTDKTAAVVRAFSDDRIVFTAQSNSGLAVARNAGIDLTSSEFLLFLDADDALQPGLTAAFSRALSEYPRLDAFLFSAMAHGSDLTTVERLNRFYARRTPGYFANGHDFLYAALQSSNLLVSACLYIFRRTRLQDGDPLRFVPVLHEDEIFTPSLLSRCRDVVVTPKRFYLRRWRDGSIMQQPSRAANVAGYLNAAQLWIDLAQRQKQGYRKLSLKQARMLYQRATMHAVNARLGRSAYLEQVVERCRIFSHTASTDYLVTRLSKKLGRFLINVRSRAHYMSLS